LYAAGERPHRLGGLSGQILDREYEFNIGNIDGQGRGEDRAMNCAERCDGFLAIDIVD
jgi:hypothetical protein